MASPRFLNVYEWLTSLPPLRQWNTNTMALSICTPMNLFITKTTHITFSISVAFHTPISLWASKPLHIKTIDPEAITQLFYSIILGVFGYGPCKKSSFRLPPVQITKDFQDGFNLAFLTLTFIVCIYEAPQELRWGCMEALREQLTSSRAKQASKQLVRVLGSNLEEQWMRSLNLAITNWITERWTIDHSFMPSPLFSYAFSASRLWKVQLYCPVIAMRTEEPSSTTHDERLLFSLKYQQLEGVIQLAYKVILKENWIDVVVKVDNIRCDVIALVSETLMAERGYGSQEKHFPSRISLQLTPTLQRDVMSVSVSKSSDNPIREVGREKALEGSFDPQGSLGITVSASESVTVSMKPWKFEQTVYGNSATLNWFLHDGANGSEVFTSKPPRFALFQPRAWFRDRYSNAYRPFTRQGGIIFAGDEYGDNVMWKMCSGALGKTMEWEIKGCIWVTYWPNKQRNSYSETRRLEFRELLELPLEKVA